MEVVKWINILFQVLSGIAACIPLAIELVAVVRKLMKEKRWSEMVIHTFDLMADAEAKFERGAERKEYVMDALKLIAQKIHYDYDEEAQQKISDMIDAVCGLSKEINK